jgi:hypothetical protein
MSSRRIQQDYRNAQACGNAIFNDAVIGRIRSGQTLKIVRSIMRHDPEQRKVEAGTESWGYLTSYQNELMTWIAFKDWKVISISEQRWVRE